MPKHGSINLYVNGNQKARYDGQPMTSTSSLTQLLNYAAVFLPFHIIIYSFLHTLVRTVPNPSSHTRRRFRW